jgi:hypothetical protein
MTQEKFNTNRIIYAAVDVGKNGAMVFIDGNNITCCPIPLIGKTKPTIDLHELSNSFSQLKGEIKHVVIEDVHAIFGVAAAATFSFGFVAGVIEMACVAHGIPYSKVAPKKWQEEMFAGIPVQYKPPKPSSKPNHKPKLMKDTKAMALMAAKRLFPNQKLTFGERATVPHDGLIDALLMAEYSRRNF